MVRLEDSCYHNKLLEYIEYMDIVEKRPTEITMGLVQRGGSSTLQGLESFQIADCEANILSQLLYVDFICQVDCHTAHLRSFTRCRQSQNAKSA